MKRWRQPSQQSLPRAPDAHPRAPSAEALQHPTVTLLERLALMLLDASVRSDDAEGNALAERFHTNIEANKDNPQFSWHPRLDAKKAVEELASKA